MFKLEPIGIGIGACCRGLPIVAAVMVAVLRMVIGSPPTFTVSVGVEANVAANIRSTRAAPNSRSEELWEGDARCPIRPCDTASCVAAVNPVHLPCA